MRRVYSVLTPSYVTDRLLVLVALHPDQLSLLEPPAEAPAHETSLATRQETTTRDGQTASDRARRQSKPTIGATSDPVGVALLTTEEAASVLRVHPRTVQRLVERGDLSAVHIGSAVRFDPQDVGGLVERVKSAGTPSTVDARVRARGRGSASFAERLRSRQHEHRAAHA
jgi:excisionase family DNA binding protein